MPDQRKIKKLKKEIKDLEDRIDMVAKLAKKWSKLTGPMSSSDERILASGAHGVHGKVHYEQGVETLQENLDQARRDLRKLQKELEEEEEG